MKLPSLPFINRGIDPALHQEIHKYIQDIRHLQAQLLTETGEDKEQVKRHLKAANLVLERLYERAVRG